MNQQKTSAKKTPKTASEQKSPTREGAKKSKAIVKSTDAKSADAESRDKSLVADGLSLERQLEREVVRYGRGERECRARARMLRTGAQKLNDVAKSIRNKPVEKAMQELRFSKRRIAGAVLKLLRSVVANAENNKQLDVDRLVVKQAWVGKSARLRRFSPRAKGRAAAIIKDFSAMTIVVEEIDEKN